MKRRKKLRLLAKAFKSAGADKILSGYLAFFFAAAIPIWLIEPSVKTYGDSLWFCFAAATTTGFGDFTAVTVVGRIITVVLSVYSIGAVAIFTAVITGFFMDLAKLKKNESVRAFMDDLEHLPELSREELQAISDRVREFDKNNGKPNK